MRDRPVERPRATSKVLSFARIFFPILTAVSSATYLLASHRWALPVALFSLAGTIISFLWPDSQGANQAWNIHNLFRGQEFGDPLRVRVGEALRHPSPPPQIFIQAPPPQPQPQYHYIPAPAAPPVYIQREVIVPMPAPRHAPPRFAPFVEELPSVFAPPVAPRVRSHDDQVRVGRDSAPAHAAAPHSIFRPPARSHEDQVRVGSDVRPAVEERPRPAASSIYGPRVSVGEAVRPASDPVVHPAPRPARDPGERVGVGEANRRRNEDESDPAAQGGDRVRVGSANT